MIQSKKLRWRDFLEHLLDLWCPFFQYIRLPWSIDFDKLQRFFHFLEVLIYDIYDPSTLFSIYCFILMCCLLNPTTIFSPLFHRCVQAHVLFSYRCVHHHHHRYVLIAEEFQSVLEESCSFVSDAKCLLSCHHFWLTRAEMCRESIQFCVAAEGWPVPKSSKCYVQGQRCFRVHWPDPDQRNLKTLCSIFACTK